MFSLLTDKDRSINAIIYQCFNLSERLLIEEDCADLPSFAPNFDGSFDRINILDIHPAQFGNPHSCRIDGPDDQTIPRILDRIKKLEYLVVAKIGNLILLDPRSIYTDNRVCIYNTLDDQETVKRTDCGDDTVEGFRPICVDRGDEGKIIMEDNRSDGDLSVMSGFHKIFLVNN